MARSWYSKGAIKMVIWMAVLGTNRPSIYFSKDIIITPGYAETTIRSLKEDLCEWGCSSGLLVTVRDSVELVLESEGRS